MNVNNSGAGKIFGAIIAVIVLAAVTYCVLVYASGRDRAGNAGGDVSARVSVCHEYI